jgi:hypothetical protein
MVRMMSRFLAIVAGWASLNKLRSIRSLPRRAFFHFRAYVATRPSLDAFAKRLFGRFPLLDRRLRATLGSERLIQAQIAAKNRAIGDLSPQARQVYLDIMQALQDIT